MQKNATPSKMAAVSPRATPNALLGGKAKPHQSPLSKTSGIKAGAGKGKGFNASSSGASMMVPRTN